MIELVSRAERYLQAHDAWELPPRRGPELARRARRPRLAPARRSRRPQADRSSSARRRSAAGFAFANRADRERVARPGTGDARPRHPHQARCRCSVATSTPTPRPTERYFERVMRRAELRMLDPAPRVVLDPALGLCTVGASAADAGVAAEIYRAHDRDHRASRALEAWQALPEADIFAVEYWDLEQAKLSQPAQRPPLRARSRSSPERPPGSAAPAPRRCCSAAPPSAASTSTRRVGDLSASAGVPRAPLRRDRARPRSASRSRPSLARVRRARHPRALRWGVPGLAPGGGARRRDVAADAVASTWTRT